MGNIKKIGQFEYRFSKERGFEWRMGDGEVHRWQLPFGKNAEENAYDDNYSDGYDNRGYNNYAANNDRYNDQYNDNYARGEYNNASRYGDGDYYDDEEFEEKPEGILGILYEYEWLMWVLLVVLPPLGIWLLWKRERFDVMIRSIISAISAVWFIILLVLIFGNIGGSSDKKDPNVPTGGNITQQTQIPSPSAPAGTPILGGAPTPTAQPRQPQALRYFTVQRSFSLRSS